MARLASIPLVFAVLFATDPLNAWGTDDTSVGDWRTIHVRTAVGETAKLRCPVPNIGYHPVSWVRQETGENLVGHTKGVEWYRRRYHAKCSDDTDDCMLEISNAQKEDTGVYQCRVDSKQVRILVNLSVVDPEATIEGEPIRVHLQSSSIDLICVIEPYPGSDVIVLWMHDGQEVSHSTHGRHIITSVETNTSTISHLVIKDAQQVDSGTYTCRPSKGHSDSVDVYVEQVFEEDFYPTVSGSNRPLPVVPAVSLLALTIAATTFTNHFG